MYCVCEDVHKFTQSDEVSLVCLLTFLHASDSKLNGSCDLEDISNSLGGKIASVVYSPLQGGVPVLTVMYLDYASIFLFESLALWGLQVGC